MCWWDWFLIRPLFVACKWLPSHYVLTWPFLCVCILLVSFPLFIGPPVLINKGPALVISFNLNYLLKDSLSKYRHMGSYATNLWLCGVQFNPQQPSTPTAYFVLSRSVIFLRLNLLDSIPLIKPSRLFANTYISNILSWSEKSFSSDPSLTL